MLSWTYLKAITKPLKYKTWNGLQFSSAWMVKILFYRLQQLYKKQATNYLKNVKHDTLKSSSWNPLISYHDSGAKYCALLSIR